MQRDYGNEIDALKNEIERLAKLITGRIPGAETVNLPEGKRIHVMKNMHPDERLKQLMSELCEQTEKEGRTGSVTYYGVFESSGRQSNWIKNGISTDDLLALIESGSAAKVLACIGSSERLNMLLAILKQPSSVAQLTETLGFGSSGQAYHHLKPLLNADLVTEDKNGRGTYIVQPHRVQGIIMLLAGISDMLDTTFTTGSWVEDDAE